MERVRTFESSATRQEFLRLLPAAVRQAPFVEAEGLLTHAEAGRSWRLRLTPLPERRAGALALPRLRVEWRFEGYTAAEVDAFLAFASACLQRGGG